jgi:hypothetical protein
MSVELAAQVRIERLLDALRRAIAPGSRQRDVLARRLVHTSGLSAAGVEWALEHCLEHSPSDAEVMRLIDAAPRARRAHVILPANVFVAAHRALALALATSPSVCVKPSRREPALIEALHAQAPDLFERVERIQPEPGDHVFAYGSDTTLEALRGELPSSTVLHAHGPGFGVAVVDLEQAPIGGEAEADREHARAIALDTASFDQRGCLSPRFVLALGEPSRARRFAERLAMALAELERQLPLGHLDPSERADTTWYRQCAACFGEVLPAGSGAVVVREPAQRRWLDGSGVTALDVPPAGRHLEVLALGRLEPALAALRPSLTSVGCSSPALEAIVRPLLDPIRVGSLGRMQQPPFDGPVDRRADPRGQII